MTVCIVDVYMDCWVEDIIREKYMVVSTDLTFWQLYWGMLVPVFVIITGKSPTQVQVLKSFKDAVRIPASMIMSTVDSNVVQQVMVTKDQ